MKRSSSVRLTLMSAVTAGGLAACGADTVTPGNFTDVGSCINAGNTSEICYAAQRSAYSAHETSAPRFANRDECLKAVDVNDCAPTRVRNADGSFSNMFMPAVAGFLVSQAMQQRRDQSGNWSSSGGGAFYASRDYPSQYRDGGNLTGSRTTGPTGTTVSTPARAPNINTTTIARSGFGSSSGFHGSSSS